MGFAALAPALISAGGSIGGSLLARKGPSNTQKDLLNEQLATARQQRTQGTSLFNLGQPLLSQAAGYYSKLLGGNPAAMQEAVAPERAALEETYLGAERGLDAGPLRGGARDYQAADLAREKAGRIGGLIPAARREAAASGASLGAGIVGAGQGGLNSAGGTYNQLSQLGEGTREFNERQMSDTFGNIGETVAGGLQAKNGKVPAGASRTGGVRLSSAGPLSAPPGYFTGPMGGSVKYPSFVPG